MNERTVVKCLLGVLVAVAVLATRNTDILFVGAGALFFILCIAYAE